MQFPLGDEQTLVCQSMCCVCTCMCVCARHQRQVQHKWNVWNTCVGCAVLVRRLADRAGPGQRALGLVLKDAGGEFLQGAAQQVGRLLGPLVPCKLFSAS